MNPQRERAWGRFYARRGLSFATVRPLTPEERLSRWASRYYALPADIRHGSKVVRSGMDRLGAAWRGRASQDRG